MIIFLPEVSDTRKRFSYRRPEASPHHQPFMHVSSVDTSYLDVHVYTVQKSQVVLQYCIKTSPLVPSAVAEVV
jgi:hypothetical protein